MGIQNLQAALDSLKAKEAEEELNAVEAGLGEYYKVWKELHQKLTLKERIEFSIFLKLMQIDFEFRRTKEEYRDFHSISESGGDLLPINPRIFLQVFFKDCKNRTLQDIHIEEDAHYFKVYTKASKFLAALSSGKKAESNMMKYVKEIYRSNHYARLFSELSENYRAIMVSDKEENGYSKSQGYGSTLNSVQLKDLYEQSKNKYWRCEEKDFLALFSKDELPRGFVEPIWLITYGKKPNRAILRDYLKHAGCRSFGKTETLELILDTNGNKISLTNSKKSAGIELEKLFDTIKLTPKD